MINIKISGRNILYILVGLVIVYGIAVIVMGFINAESFIAGVIANIPVVLVGGVFSTILIFSAKGSWGKILRKFGRDGEAKAYEAAVEKYGVLDKEDEKEEKTGKAKCKRQKNTIEDHTVEHKVNCHLKIMDYESCRENRRKLTKKDFLISFIILLVGIILFSVFYSIYNSQQKKEANPNRIETTATAQFVQVNDSGKKVLRYVYWVYDEETNKNKGYVFTNSVQINGFNIVEGKSIKVCYSKQTPEIAWLKVNLGLYLSLAILGLCFGIIVALLKIFSFYDPTVGIGVGGIFFLFAYGMIFYIIEARGITLLEALFSGVAIYATTIFGFLGLYFIGFGVYSLINRIYSWCLWRNKDKYEI